MRDGLEFWCFSLAVKLRVFGTLTSEIINTNLCMNCGACIASCPINVLYMSAEEKPVIKGPCALCQVCYYSCPRVDLPLEEIEEELFGRSRTKEELHLGIYQEAYTVRAADERVRSKGADGGAVTALLMHALKTKMLECAAVMGYTVTDSKFFLGDGIPMKTVPNVATDPDEALRAASSKYAPGSAVTGLTEASALYPNGDIGVVALPCETQGLRKLHTTWMATVKYGGPGVEPIRSVFVIALFCTHIFKYDRLVKEYLLEKQKILPDRISKLNIKKGHLLVYENENVILDVPLRDVKDAAQEYCNFCRDYTGELADLSVGSDGSPPGWTTFLIRTQLAREIVMSAIEAGVIEAVPFSQAELGVERLRRISGRKRRRLGPYLRKKGTPSPFT